MKKLGLILTILLCAQSNSYAALNAACVFEFRTAGEANNGGGFKTGATGVDYSQQDAAQITRTDLVIGNPATTTLTSAGTPFTTNEVGNIIRIHAGTNFTTGWYEITAVDGSAIATVDRSVGTAGATGGSGKVGGAISTFQDAFFETLVAGNTVHVKNGTYTLAENIDVAKDGTTTAPITIVGYNSARNDAPTDDTRPLIAATTFTTTWDDNWVFKHLRMTSATTTGWKGDNNCLWVWCKNTATGTSRPAFTLGNGSTFNQMMVFCEAQATGIGVQGLGGTVFLYGCYIHDCGSAGIEGSLNTIYVINCILDTNAFININNPKLVINTTIYNGGTGIQFNQVTGFLTINNIIDTCTTGMSNTGGTGTEIGYMNYNNFNGNTTARSNVPTGANDTALDPGFTDAAGGNFAIGTNLKAKGAPGTFPGALSTGYLDTGAVQRQEAAASTGGGSFTWVE